MVPPFLLPIKSVVRKKNTLMKGKTSENRQARHTAQELVDFLKEKMPQFKTLNNTLVIHANQ